jgi:predicted Zn-dependent protease
VATLIAQEAAKEAGSRNVVQLTEAFGGILDDFVTAIVESGYSREYEEEADEAAVGLLRRSGYDPRALVTVLRKLEKRQASSSGDLFSTHPAVKDRIGRIAPLAGAGSAETVSARQQRFEAATARARSPQS